MVKVDANINSFSTRFTRALRNIVRKFKSDAYFNSTMIDLSSIKIAENLKELRSLLHQQSQYTIYNRPTNFDLNDYSRKISKCNRDIENIYNISQIYYQYLKVVEDEISPEQTKAEKLEELIEVLQENAQSLFNDKANVDNIIEALQTQIGNKKFDLTAVRRLLLDYFESKVGFQEDSIGYDKQSPTNIKSINEQLKLSAKKIKSSVEHFKTPTSLKDINYKRRTHIFIGLSIFFVGMIVLHVLLPFLIPVTATSLIAGAIFAGSTTLSAITSSSLAIVSDRQCKEAELLDNLKDVVESIEDKIDILQDAA